MMRVNGIPVEARGSLLEACRAAGARIFAFCQDPRLSVGGHCRACLVEVNGRCVPSCAHPALDGAEVLTDSPRLKAYRRDLGELMISESAPRGRVGGALETWGVTGERYGRAGTGSRRDESHPYLRVDLDACILCRRCVRACEEIQGQFVYAIEGRGSSSTLAWGADRFVESACVSCGACVTACPTEALSSADLERPSSKTDVVRTTCGYCGVGCQLDVHVAEDRVVRIEGGDSPVNRGHLCVKGRFAHGFSRHPDRLRTPLVRRQGRLVEASWDEAIAIAAQELKRWKGSIAGLSSSRCTNEENYLFQKWMRAGLGTHDVDSCARVCHAPSAVGMRTAFGTGAATNSLADIERADLLMVIGANVTEAHPVTGARLRQAALRGTPLVVIDPRRTELAEIADVHLQLRPGTNVPVLNALASVLVAEDLVNHEFLKDRVEGWESFREFIRAQSPEAASAVSGVPAERIRDAARRYGRAQRPMMVHGLGVTEHLQGSEAVMLICNLALLTGAVGREGVGVNPLRGQNNVQGAADMGCQPDLLTGYAPWNDAAARARFEAAWGRPLPEKAGRTLPQMYQAARAGDLHAMVIFGEDVVQTDPDSGQTRAALERLDFLMVQELFLSETARLAHVVLPGASFLEKDGTFTNGERRVQRVRRALPPPGDPARADGGDRLPAELPLSGGDHGGDRATGSCVRRGLVRASRGRRAAVAGALGWPSGDADPPPGELSERPRQVERNRIRPLSGTARRSHARHRPESRALQRRHHDAPHAQSAAGSRRAVGDPPRRCPLTRPARRRPRHALQPPWPIQCCDRGHDPGAERHRVPDLPLSRDPHQRPDRRRARSPLGLPRVQSDGRRGAACRGLTRVEARTDVNE